MCFISARANGNHAAKMRNITNLLFRQMATRFGYVAKKTKTGFVEDGKKRHISHTLADLEAEIEEMNNEKGFGDQGSPTHIEDKVSHLEKEINKLKEDIAAFRNQ